MTKSLFADDQVLIANDEDDIAYMTRKLIEEYRKLGLNINTSKTEYLVIGKNPKDLQVGNEVIRCTNEFKYLGSYIASDGTTRKYIKYRITQGKDTEFPIVVIKNKQKYKNASVPLYSGANYNLQSRMLATDIESAKTAKST